MFPPMWTHLRWRKVGDTSKYRWKLPTLYLRRNDYEGQNSILRHLLGIHRKYMHENNGNITLENPRMLVNASDGKVGFARGICMTGQENPKTGMFYVGGVVIVANQWYSPLREQQRNCNTIKKDLSSNERHE